MGRPSGLIPVRAGIRMRRRTHELLTSLARERGLTPSALIGWCVEDAAQRLARERRPIASQHDRTDGQTDAGTSGEAETAPSCEQVEELASVDHRKLGRSNCVGGVAEPTRSHCIGLRIGKTLYAMIQECARADGLARSLWIRRALAHAAAGAFPAKG